MTDAEAGWSAPPLDPDGQPLMDALVGVGVPGRKAYSVIQGVRNMSGQNVIAEMEKRFAENRADIRAIQWMIGVLIAIIVLLATVFVPLALRSDPADVRDASASAIQRTPQGSAAGAAIVPGEGPVQEPRGN